jgi:hypothetical protein
LYTANDPCGPSDAEPAVQRPCAVVTDADCHAFVVEHLPDVVRVNSVHDEAHRRTAVLE